MTPFDMVNAAFEATGGLFVLMNVRQVWKHRLATGVHWIPVLFFTAWGFWNMAYYPSLDQWFSALCGAGVCIANCAYFYSVWKFRPRAERAGAFVDPI